MIAISIFPSHMPTQRKACWLALLWSWYHTTMSFAADDSERASYQVSWSDSVQVAKDVHSSISCQIEYGPRTLPDIEFRDSLLPGSLCSKWVGETNEVCFPIPGFPGVIVAAGRLLS